MFSSFAEASEPGASRTASLTLVASSAMNTYGMLGNITYEVISAGLANATTDTIAIVTNPGMEQARQIIDAALERSDVQFAAGKSADPLSRILTLATCTTDSGTRYVVTAIQISGDDTNAAD